MCVCAVCVCVVCVCVCAHAVCFQVAEDVLEMWQDKLDHSLEGRIEEDMMLGGRRRGEKESWGEPFSTQSREEEKG